MSLEALRGKKLLILVGGINLITLVQRAKELGIYTIVTDYYDTDRSPAKLVADEYWDISWDDIDTDHPTRHIRSIRKVFEVSAVTFPAYAQTSIQARGLADALESAKASLESARAERRALEAKKARIRILMELGGQDNDN